MMAYAAWKIYQKDKDKAFLREIYPALAKLYNYFLIDRDPRKNHLIGIINPDESGEDNSPRFDIVLNLPAQQTLDENFQKRVGLIKQNRLCNFEAPFCMKNFFWVKDVPFNVIFVENLKNLSDIASQLGYEVDADFFFRKSQEVIQSMRQLMLEDGIFWSTYGSDYKKIKVKTWAIFMPLFAKIVTKKEAESLIENFLMNPEEFYLNYLVPTVSKSEPAFDPKGFWRGPIWIAINWFIFKGLKKYGFNKAAAEVLKSSLKLIEKSGFREQFNPLTGEGLGAQNFTWGGLVLDMMES